MSVVKLPTTKSLDDLPLQPTSYEIWDMKYRLKDKDGTPIDEDVEDTYRRVALALAEVEPHDKDYWRNEFLWALRNGAIPAGRIMSNAGADEFKPATSTINCTVSQTVHDSMEGIMEAVKQAAVTLAAGCGIGYCFSTIRPRGAFVTGAGASTNGPICFMDVFDKMCFTVSSAGGRRGAQMATFDVSHPDVMEFIKAKREDGRLRQFNCSVLITDEFMRAVEADAEWKLRFPLLKGEDESNCETLTDPDTGVVCKVYETVQARDIWEAIMTSTYEYAEPGFILIDSMNNDNNNWFCEELRATNPCGEVPLPAYGACLLGSVNLTKFVEQPFTRDAYFDWEKYKTVVRVFSRMLDNVVEINNLPLPQQRSEIAFKRRHGMGVLGLGSTLAMLGIRYGDESSLEFTEEICKQMALEGLREGVALAKEKDPAPIMNTLYEMQLGSPLYKKAIKYGMLTEAGFKNKLADGSDTLVFKGKVLWAHSLYMQKVREADPELWQNLVEYGCRYTHATSIAPTGTISLSLANNACVAKGTLVETSEGAIPIELVTTDMKVKSYSPSRDTFKYREVLFAGPTRLNTDVYEVELVDGSYVRVTEDHKLLVRCTTTGKVSYKEVRELLATGVGAFDVVCDSTEACQLCKAIFPTRIRLMRHITREHSMTSCEYQYRYDNQFNSCPMCGSPLSLAFIKAKWRPGTKMIFCSADCIEATKAKGPKYYKRKYKLSDEEAKQRSLSAYRAANPNRLPATIGYWLAKGCTEEEAVTQISKSQSKASLEAFIRKYGKEEGTKRHAEFREKKRLQALGDSNPMYGHVHSNEWKGAHSKLMQQVMRQPDMIDKIVESINTRGNFPFVGLDERKVLKLLDTLRIEYKHQFAVEVDRALARKLGDDRLLLVHDIYLPQHHLIIEVNEPWHRQDHYLKQDHFKREHAKHLGYQYVELWTDVDLQTQLAQALETGSQDKLEV